MKRLIPFIVILVFITAGSAFAATPSIPSISSFPVGSGAYMPAPIFLPLPPPTWVDNIVLTANVISYYTIPTGAKYLLFSSSTTPVYMSFNTNATIATTNITTGYGSLIGPVLVDVRTVTSVSMVSPVATIVSIAVFKN